MITKEIEKQVTVLPDGQLQVLEITNIVEDGATIASTNHRKVIAPGDDVTNETGLAKEIAEKMHTKERKDAYIAKNIKD